MMKADPVRDETRTTHNYFAHGGNELVIGGKLTFLPTATVEGGDNLFGGAGIMPAANLPASDATTIAALKDDFNALLALPGVGRKSANLIIGDVFGKPAIVTDTHCIRLCNRIGLVDNVKEPAKVERELWKIIPPAEGNGFCHRLVDHGRAVCTARTKPYCDKCCLADVCRARKEFLHE